MFEKCLYFNSNALARSVTRIWTEAYKPFDLSPPHAFLIKVVLAEPGILPCDLADTLSLSRSTVTRFLDSLEKKKYVRRKAVGKDGREKHVFPTAKALKIADDLNATRALLTQKIETILGGKEMSETVRNLRDIRESLEK